MVNYLNRRFVRINVLNITVPTCLKYSLRFVVNALVESVLNANERKPAFIYRRHRLSLSLYSSGSSNTASDGGCTHKKFSTRTTIENTKVRMLVEAMMAAL